jgi:hypothetical protein
MLRENIIRVLCLLKRKRKAATIERLNVLATTKLAPREQAWR